jgi:hypothetical protein
MHTSERHVSEFALAEIAGGGTATVVAAVCDGAH